MYVVFQEYVSRYLDASPFLSDLAVYDFHFRRVTYPPSLIWRPSIFVPRTFSTQQPQTPHTSKPANILHPQEDTTSSSSTSSGNSLFMSLYSLSPSSPPYRTPITMEELSLSWFEFQQGDVARQYQLANPQLVLSLATSLDQCYTLQQLASEVQKREQREVLRISLEKGISKQRKALGK